MNESNVALFDIIPFNEDERWYLKLIYKYENKEGKHTVIIPKAAIPFTQTSIPIVHTQLSDRLCSYEPPYIDCNDSMHLYDSISDLASKRGVKKPCCYFDIITEYATKEMTLDDIEKELGYKVKIINKEKKADA